MKKSILLLAFIFISTLTFAQLSIIYYKIEFNEVTDLFDLKMYIEDGSATSAADRLQQPAQISIIAATGTAVNVVETFFPIYNNETYTGPLSIEWIMDNVANDPAELPGYDVFRIVPEFSDPSHYNDLDSGDEITLFSLSAVGGDVCSLSLRLLENDEDPTNIGGVDFTNTMMIGSTDEIYFGNLYPDEYWQDVDVTLTQGSVCLGECITLEPTFNCIMPGLTYEWSTGETTETITICPDINDEYILFLNGPNGYSGETTTYITIDPSINTFGVTDLCVGAPVFYIPNSGLWTSSNVTVATVSSTGLVTPISAGTATITNTSSSGSCSDQVFITVTDPEPPTVIGSNEICAGDEIQLTPTTGISWKSANHNIASIDNTGLVTGVSMGTTVFTYTTDVGQCESDPSPSITVLQIPEPVITGPDMICVSGTTTLTPIAGVTWVSSDDSVATIDNSGNVTGVSEGTASFTFTDLANGCTSGESEPVNVLPSPIVQIFTDSECQNRLIDAAVNMQGGTWIVTVISGSPLAASIDSFGTIETNEEGVVSVQYISAQGCISDDSVLLTILPKPNAVPSSNSPSCIGENILLTATSPPGSNYSYQWTGPNGFSSNQMNVTIPNAGLDDSGTYTLVASENGCEGESLAVDVWVEDCDPCDDMTTSAEWIKVPASMGSFSSIGDYEIGRSLVTGRELEDFVYYNESQEEIRLIKNNGNGYFEEEVVLFDLPYIDFMVEIDIVDIDQDGLNDIVTYQPEEPSGNAEVVELTITIFKNINNYSFEKSLQIVEADGNGFFIPTRKYRDLDNGGYLDIIPLSGSIYFTDNWEENSYEIPGSATPFLTEDFNEDGLLDILGHGNKLFTNNGDRTFSLAMINGDAIASQGLYDNGTGVFNDGYISYQVTKGDNPSIEICSDPAISNYKYFFYANINSSSVESGVITTVEGFHVFETPLTCENSNQYESNFSFIPHEDGKIDFTDNGYSDFVTVEGGDIFVWVNPNDQPKLVGMAFIDNNGDGILNENDSPLRNVLISIEPGNLSVLTNDDGGYQFTVPEGNYTLTAHVNEGEWIMDELTLENIDIAEPCNLGFDFGFVPDLTSIPSANLSMVNTNARCDFEVKFTITVENTGTEPLEGELQFEFDDKTSFFSTEITGASVIGNKVTTNIGPLTPFQPQKYVVKVKMPSGSSVLPMLDFNATLSNEMGEIITEYGYTEQLRCSYDPNDKRVFPDREGDENLTLMDENLEYTIRFQNNGNDTAYNVKIVDPLDSNIDPSTIRVLGSSHDVETCIEGTDLIFLFENIYLVDSTTNYPASQGYVTFRCNAKEGRAEFTIANNTADIFFDTNLPISTNQTINTLVSELCKDESTTIDKYICSGEEYLGYTESGTYTETFDLLYGCDSLVTINLDVQGITYSQQQYDVCKGMAITIGTEEYLIDDNITITDTIVNDKGCISNIEKFEITVVPDLVIMDELNFCINENGLLPSSFEGIWSVEDETIITVDDQGIITTVNSGETILQYLDQETGCTDEINVAVFPEPTIINEGSNQICINEMNQFTSDSEGTWVSSDLEIATINNDGLAVGKTPGTVTLIFSNSLTGCSVSTEIEILPLSDANCVVSANDLLNNLIRIFPNPASEIVFIESDEKWNAIKLINAQGQLVMNKLIEYQPKKQVNIGELTPGLYFVVIETDQAVITKRLVVD